jgi:hypothetical protein
MGLMSRYIDRMAQRGEEEASLLLARYRQMLDSSAEAQSIKQIASTDGRETLVGERAVAAHRALFQELLKSSTDTSLVRSKQRVQVLEQFCIAMWMRFVGKEGYKAMVAKLKQG